MCGLTGFWSPAHRASEEASLRIIRGMRDRLATVDGRVAVESAPGGGTHVLVEVP